MPLSPPTAGPGTELNKYLAGWKAVEKLVHQGQSWSGHERKCVYLNTHGGRFANVSAVTGLDFEDDGRALAVVDWDLDGDLDIWMANRTGPRLRLLRNESDASATGNRFVAFKLQGVTANRDGIGARVEVHLKNQPKLIQTLYAGDAYLSQSSKWLHFGLGRDPQIDKVTVRWPGGTTETFTAIEPNRRYLLKQSTGEALEWFPPKRTVNLAASTQVAPKASDTGRVLLSTPYPMPLLTFSNFVNSTAVGSNAPAGPLLINLWASWCQPCLAELQALAAEQQNLRAAGLEILALSVDGLAKDQPTTLAEAQRVLEKMKFPFRAGAASAEWLDKMEIVLDRLFDRHIALAVPTSFLLDRDGHLSVIYRGSVNPETLLHDVTLFDATRTTRRDLAVPFPGRWYSQPGHVVWEQAAADFAERFPEEAERYLRIALQDAARPSNALLPASGRSSTNELAQQNMQMAMALLRQGKFEQASASIGQLLAAEPENTEALIFQAELLRLQGKYREAIESYHQVLRLKPDTHEVANRLAWMLATHPDPGVRNGEEALQLARHACDATGNQAPNFLDTLAAACAETGRFAEAVTVARHAVELLKASGDQAKLREAENRLRLYELGQPFHERGRERKPEPAR